MTSPLRQEAWQALLVQLRELEGISATDNLTICRPTGRHMPVFLSLFAYYENADHAQRNRARRAVSELDGICNQLLGFVHVAARRLRGRAAARWLRLGLLAASALNGRCDWRDLLVALARLCCAAEEAGLSPTAEFRAVAELSSYRAGYPGDTTVRTILTQFPTYAVLEEERRRRGAAVGGKPMGEVVRPGIPRWPDEPTSEALGLVLPGASIDLTELAGLFRRQLPAEAIAVDSSRGRVDLVAAFADGWMVRAVFKEGVRSDAEHMASEGFLQGHQRAAEIATCDSMVEVMVADPTVSVAAFEALDAAIGWLVGQPGVIVVHPDSGLPF